MTTWLILQAHGFQKERRLNLDTTPCSTIAATGMTSFGYRIEDDGKPMKRKQTQKPPYAVPTMPEIAAIPWNGLTVASTFSGAGGSCLGYRMAGFKVVWANEFVPAAQESYKANAAEDCILDTRDIKVVTAEEVIEATGLAKGELDLFDGSPPCQAFSTAGKREKGWGDEKKYEHGATQKNEELFTEYIRLLRGLKPRVFIAENVSGLVKGTAKGFFLEILAGLEASGYRVEVRLLDAQWLGVPQSRQRVIFCGVREDIDRAPAFPKPLRYRYSVRDAIPWIADMTLRDVEPVIHDTCGFVKNKPITDQPCPTITTGVNALCSTHFLVAGKGEGDTKTSRRPIEAEADISRFAIGEEWNKLKEGEQSEKYFSLQKAHKEKPSPCIQASHGTTSLAGVTHPTERRKFTIAELRRICSFPDDFILTGSYAQQWERLGNSVPPLMMRAIAEAVRDEILLP